MGTIYGNNNLLQCHAKNTFSSQLNNLSLFQLDKYAFLTAGSIGLLMNASIVFLSLKYRQLRKRPGDLFSGVSTAETLLCSHYIIQSIHSFSIEKLSSDSTFCQLNGFLDVFANTLEFFYSLVINLYVICAVKNIRFIKLIQNWQIHILIITSSVTVSGLFLLTNSIGKTFSGLCSIKSQNNFPQSTVILFVMFVLSSLSTLSYLNFKLPNVSKYQNLLKFYSRYLNTSAVLWCLLIISHIMVYLNCRYIHQSLVNIFVSLGSISKILLSIVLPVIRMSDPNVQIFFKLMQKKLEKKTQVAANKNDSSFSRDLHTNLVKDSHSYSINNIDNMMKNIEMADIVRNRISNSQESEPSSHQLQQLQQSVQPEPVYLEDFQIDHLNIERKTSQDLTGRISRTSSFSMTKNILDRERQSLELEGNYYENLTNSQRESILYRILSGILLSDKRKYKTFKIDINNIRGSSIFEQKKIYTLDDKLILEQLSGIPKKCLELHQFENIRMTSYCPLLFQSLIERDKVNIESSLDLIANKNDIIIAANESNDPLKRRMSILQGFSIYDIISQPPKTKFSNKIMPKFDLDEKIPSSSLMQIIQGTKLKSYKIDDYIFYSNDKQLILKTITQRQLNYLLKIIQDYYSHIKQNPQSLLMKIYGLFEFKGVDSSNLIVMLMKNIAPCPSQFIKRKYDLKGSTYNRRVLVTYPTRSSSKAAEESAYNDKMQFKSSIGSRPIVDEEVDKFYSSILLKDVDFIELESKVSISKRDKEGLLQILERDVLFLNRNGLINYSLMLMKVEWDKCLDNFKLQQQKINNTHLSLNKEISSNIINSSPNNTPITTFISSTIKSETEPGIYYMLGIIDFLHKYTITKRLARLSKIVKNMSTRINPSTANSTLYSQRFLHLCRTIIDLPDFQSPPCTPSSGNNE